MFDETPLTPRQVLEMDIYGFALYCEDRQAFALMVQRLSSLLGIVSGTALVAVARSDNPLFSLVFGFATVLLSGIVLVFDMAGIARAHGELRKRNPESHAERGKRLGEVGELRPVEWIENPSHLFFIALDAPGEFRLRDPRRSKSLKDGDLRSNVRRNIDHDRAPPLAPDRGEGEPPCEIGQEGGPERV